MGLASLKPGRGASAGWVSRVTVSPTRVSLTVLTPEMMYPTEPAESSGRGTLPSRKIPTSSTLYAALFHMKRMMSPGFSRPEKTLQLMMTPRKGSYCASKVSAFSGSSGFPGGGGILSTIASKRSSMPIPSFAEQSRAWSASSPSSLSICSFTLSTSAEGRSILLMTGMIVRSCSMAMYTFEMVWACTPWDASTSSRTPSQDARERETS